MNAVVLRRCDPAADRLALRRIAERDSAAPLTGPVLGAESEGELRAAICLDCGRVIADPFQPTAELVELLRARAAQLRSAGRVRLREGHRQRALDAVRSAPGPLAAGSQTRS